MDGVRVVATGEALLGPETTRRLINRFIEGKTPNAPLPPELDELTARELEVLKPVTRGVALRQLPLDPRASGEPDAKITVELTVATSTSPCASLPCKLGADDRGDRDQRYEPGLVRHARWRS